MSEEIKRIKNTPEEVVYQHGEGKSALRLTISQWEENYEYIERRGVYETFKEYRPTDCISIYLESNSVRLYFSKVKGQKDYIIKGYDHALWSVVPGKMVGNVKRGLAENLYNDNSKEASAVKKFLSKIKGDALVDEINKFIEEEPLRQEEMLRELQEEKARKDAEKQKMKVEAEQRRIAEKQNIKNAVNVLDNFVGNKLAALRKKVAHGIDETLGTNLEEKKLTKPMKKIEKVVSDKLFGKVKE